MITNNSPRKIPITMWHPKKALRIPIRHLSPAEVVLSRWMRPWSLPPPRKRFVAIGRQVLVKAGSEPVPQP